MLSRCARAVRFCSSLRAEMTAHYSVAQVLEIREALEKITDEKHANNVSLASIIRQAKIPTKVPTEAKRPEAVLASGR